MFIFALKVGEEEEEDEDEKDEVERIIFPQKPSSFTPIFAISHSFWMCLLCQVM